MTVVAAAVIPGAPVLVPGIDGAQRAAEEPRRACLRALTRVMNAKPRTIVVLAEGDRDEAFTRDAPLGLHRFGGFTRAPALQDLAPLPVPLAVGAALHHSAGWTGAVDYLTLDRKAPAAHAVDVGRRLRDTRESVGLVLLASGSARTTDRAPGAFHPGAQTFNSAYVAALRSGRLESLLEAEDLAYAEQLSDARLPLQVLAGAWPEGPVDTVIDFAEEFSGVCYVCASFVMGGQDRE